MTSKELYYVAAGFNLPEKHVINWETHKLYDQPLILNGVITPQGEPMKLFVYSSVNGESLSNTTDAIMYQGRDPYDEDEVAAIPVHDDLGSFYCTYAEAICRFSNLFPLAIWCNTEDIEPIDPGSKLKLVEAHACHTFLYDGKFSINYDETLKAVIEKERVMNSIISKYDNERFGVGVASVTMYGILKLIANGDFQNENPFGNYPDDEVVNFKFFDKYHLTKDQAGIIRYASELYRHKGKASMLDYREYLGLNS